MCCSWSGETNPCLWRQMLQEDAYCISYKEHKTNEYVWQQDVRNFYCELPNIANYHGLATSAIMIRCQKLYYSEQWTAIITEEEHVSDGGTTSRNGHVSYCLCCCASQTTKSMVTIILRNPDRNMTQNEHIYVICHWPEVAGDVKLQRSNRENKQILCKGSLQTIIHQLCLKCPRMQYQYKSQPEVLAWWCFSDWSNLI